MGSNDHHCSLLGGWFGLVVQGMLGAAAICGLLLKLYLERPRRNWPTFIRDSGKQIVSALIAHVWNILFADMLQTSTMEPCVFYLMNFLVDNVLGIPMYYVLLKIVENVASSRGYQDLFLSGYYGTPPKMWRWGVQLGVWVVIVSSVKWILFGAVLVPAKRELYDGGDWMLSPLEDHPRAELVVAMVAVPCFVNVVGFWIIDSFLELKRSDPHARLDSTASASDVQNYSAAGGVIEETTTTYLLSSRAGDPPDSADADVAPPDDLEKFAIE